MSLLAAITPLQFRLILLGASAFVLYGAGRLMMGAVPARADRPGLRALLGFGMVLIVALVAVIMGRPELGLHLPVAASTAALTFGVSSLILGRPLPQGRIGNASWALVAPAVAIAFVGGFGGRLDAGLLAALALYGVAAMASWREPADEEVEETKHRGGPGALAVVLWIGGLGLSALAAVLVMLGLPGLEASGVPADALAVVFLIAPAIVVPLFFELLPPCRSLGWNASTSVLVKFAILNLCFALPAVSLMQADVGVIRGLWESRVATATATRPATLPATEPATRSSETRPAADVIASSDAATKLVFPAMPGVALRVDLLIMASAMLLLIPIAAGWQRPGGMEAAALLACYLLALMLVMWNVWRR